MGVLLKMAAWAAFLITPVIGFKDNNQAYLPAILAGYITGVTK